MSWVRAPHRTPNWKENDFDVVLFLFFPDEAGCAFRIGLLFGSGGKPLFWQLWHSVQAMLFSFLVFVILAAGNAFSFLALWHSLQAMPSHFWLCGTRCRQCSSPFCRLWHSVPERASYGTEYAFGAQNRLLGYATHFQRHSVQKTGFYGTEGIFGTRNPLLWYGTDHSMLKKAITETTKKNRTNLATCPV